MRRPSVCSLSPSAPVAALTAASRSYFWPYRSDFVPPGAPLSAFQSSASPAARRSVARDFALAPLFGARPLCCTLGTPRPPREVMRRKSEIARLLCALAHVRGGGVALGPIAHAAEMMRFKPHTPQSPRLGDERAENVNAYGRKPVCARTFVDVFVAEEVSREEAATIGLLVQQKMRKARMEKRDEKGDGSGERYSGMEEARELVYDLGMVHCEVPESEEEGFVFDSIDGVPIDGDEMERIANRWDQRCSEVN